MVSNHQLPTGFRAAGVQCGIKPGSQKLDLALFVSDTPCTAAGVFTQNRVCGAPVIVSRERVPTRIARGVIINSGNANACTGERGVEDARWMTAKTAGLLGCDGDAILVCSTGVIGRFLPRERLADGIPRVVEALATNSDGLESAAQAMMTTDTFAKLSTRELSLNDKIVRVSGVAKGAAMIGPNMATMLSVIMTDATLSPEQADAMLRHAVDRSFNCISVEGHTSTSDTVLLLANGAAKTGPIADEGVLQSALDAVCEELAVAIIRDAEGAEHLITIDVSGARNREEAHRIAKTVAESALVKTAITGADPNWGRIVSAVGYSGVDLEENQISLTLNGVRLYEHGTPLEFDAKVVSEGLRNRRAVEVKLDLTLGDASCRFWTSDLTAEYVRLNADYTT